MKEWLESLLEKVSKQMFENMGWFDDSIPIYIYGTIAQDVYRSMLQKGWHVSAYLDHRQPLPYSVSGAPMMQPDVARGAVVLMGIHNRDADVLSIIRKLEEIGCKYVVTSVEIYDFLGDLLGTRYLLTKRSFYDSCQLQIKDAYSLLSDEKSRELYYSVLRFCMTGNNNVLPAPDKAHQCFSFDLPRWKTPLRLVDCGAFDGDTLSAFLENNIEIEAVAAFESDMRNYKILPKYIYQHRDQMGHDALLGARRLISTYTSGIAALLYHSPEHLWQLPMLVESIAPGNYKYHMRSHAMNDFELVMYTIPAELK